MQNDKYFSFSRQEVKPFVPKDAKKILEVGCGNGNFAKSLKTSESEIWGTDINPEVQEVATQIFDTFILGDFSNNIEKFPQNYFDCIIFNDILEHLTYPEEILNKCKNLLNQKGVIVASIPNFLCYSNLLTVILFKDFKYDINGGILDKTHFRFFTKKSMMRMFEQCNLKIKNISGVNRSISPISFIIVLLSFGYFKDIFYPQYVIVSELN